MAEPPAQILPKGIVTNAPGIYQSVEELGQQPVGSENIIRMWKVFTTTSGSLHDPTAQRLEYFWWRILGSRAANLPSTVVSNQFEHISHGPTFLNKPLPGPPNRDESGSRNLITAKDGPGGSSTATIVPQKSVSRPTTTQSLSTGKIPAVSPLPPILKKAKAPPTPGRRSTVEFADTEDIFGARAPISPNEHVTVEPPSPDVEVAKERSNKVHRHTKAAKSAKKRPQVVRRKSSQSSAERLKAGVPQTSSSSETHSPGLARQLSQTKGKGKAVAVSKFQENFSPSPEQPKKISNSDGKRLAKSHSVELEGIEPAVLALRRIENLRFSTLGGGDPGPSTLHNLQLQQSARTERELDGAIISKEELEVQQQLLEQFAKAKAEKSQSLGKCPSIDAFSASEIRQGKATRESAELQRATTASIDSTLAKAADHIELGYDGTESAKTVPKRDKDKKKEQKKPKTDDLFAKRPIPPLPSAASASEPSTMTRSKSTLTLLLDEDRRRSTKHDSPDNTD